MKNKFREAGRKAYNAKKRFTSNPHRVGSKRWDDWNQGFLFAGIADEEKFYKAFPHFLIES